MLCLSNAIIQLLMYLNHTFNILRLGLNFITPKEPAFAESIGIIGKSHLFYLRKGFSKKESYQVFGGQSEVIRIVFRTIQLVFL